MSDAGARIEPEADLVLAVGLVSPGLLDTPPVAQRPPSARSRYPLIVSMPFATLTWLG